MYVVRLTRVTIATRILVDTFTLCYSIWAADLHTVTLYGYHMLMQVNTLLTLCDAIACHHCNVQTLRDHNSFFLLT